MPTVEGLLVASDDRIPDLAAEQSNPHGHPNPAPTVLAFLCWIWGFDESHELPQSPHLIVTRLVDSPPLGSTTSVSVTNDMWVNTQPALVVRPQPVNHIGNNWLLMGGVGRIVETDEVEENCVWWRDCRGCVGCRLGHVCGRSTRLD